MQKCADDVPGIATANTLPEIAEWDCTRPAKFSADVHLVVGQRLGRLCPPLEVSDFLRPPPVKSADRGLNRWLVKRHPPTSERVAMAEAVAERLKGRQLANLKQNRGGNISTSDDVGKTRDLAAAKAGFGSGKTLEAAQAVIAKGGQIAPTHCKGYEQCAYPSGKGLVKRHPPVNLADRSMGPMCGTFFPGIPTAGRLLGKGGGEKRMGGVADAQRPFNGR